MIDPSRLDELLERLPKLTVSVIGDLFLDRYLDLDATLTEPSLETGLDAYQVTRVRSYPGAAGTVINNLAALGVGRIWPVSIVGDDGEGHELRQALGRLATVDGGWIFTVPERRTPTYTKPMLCRRGEPPCELNRLDIKNRKPLPETVVAQLLRVVENVFQRSQALIVLDQVSEENCGVVNDTVREAIARRAAVAGSPFTLADSRERIGAFRSVAVKPNVRECRRALGGHPVAAEVAAAALARRTGGLVYCTEGERGILVARPDGREPTRVPAYAVSGPIDPVGAGDSASAGIACAMAAGATPEEAADLGNLMASVTVRQLGTTGTATPEQVRSARAAAEAGRA